MENNYGYRQDAIDVNLEQEKTKQRSIGKFYAKTFIFFGAELLLTFGFTALISFIFNKVAPITEENNAIVYYIVTIVSAIILIILSIVINYRGLFKVLRQGTLEGKSQKVSTIIIPFVLYIICLSFLLSSFSFYLGVVEALPIAILITSGCFALCALFAFLIKGYTTMRIIGIIALSLVTGACIIFLINGLIYIFNPEYFELYFFTYLGLEVILLIYGLVITMIDFFRMKKIAFDTDIPLTTALSLFFSFSLYNDFIYILIKILPYIIASRSSK